MVTVEELKQLAKELNLCMWFEDNKWFISYKSSLFDEGDTLLSTLNGGLLEYDILSNKLWIFQDLKYEEAMTGYYFYHMVTKYENDEGTLHQDKTLECIKQELMEAIKTIKTEYEKIKMKRIEGDFT